MADDFNAAANLANGDDTDKQGLVMDAHFIEKASHPRLALSRLRASLMTFVSIKYTGGFFVLDAFEIGIFADVGHGGDNLGKGSLARF